MTEESQNKLFSLTHIDYCIIAFQSVGYEEHNWVADPWSGGCYTSTYPPGVMTRFGRLVVEH